MKTKWLDARIKRYEDWDKHDVIKPNEKLELIELRAIKKQLLLHNVSQQRELLIAYRTMLDFDVKHEDFKESVDYFLKHKESYL